ncbi:SHOCT domain-containing protein [Neobacillus sp. BF23-41]|uniref:SHOCT domain-containing protein n=1 Tax=Neobacillus sp. BF23-41 TaxID=3240280 RepID=UPI0034E4D775
MGCLVALLSMFLFFFIIWGFSVSPFLGIVLLVVIFGGGLYLGNLDGKKQAKIQNDKINKLFEMQSQLKDFTVSQKYQSYDIQSSILLDEDRKKVCFIFANNNSTEIYDYKEILEAEILENGKTITSTSRSSQIGGAILGGVIAGGVGAVVGGLSGKQSSELEVYKIDLKVVVNNTKSPNKIINFLQAEPDLNGKPLAIKKDSPKYKSASNSANHWHSLLSLLIKQDESSLLDEKTDNDFNHSSLSVADEIKKLADLLNQGLLTQDEFNQQKQKLLSS